MSSTASSTSSIAHVIVDTAAFIANQTNQYTGAKLYTTAECLAEIRSEAALTAATLTIDDVLVRTPTDEGLEFVTTAAQTTGDFRVLSKTDIGLLALSYDIARAESNVKPEQPRRLGVVKNTLVSIAKPRPPPSGAQLTVGFVNGQNKDDIDDDDAQEGEDEHVDEVEEEEGEEESDEIVSESSTPAPVVDGDGLTVGDEAVQDSQSSEETDESEDDEESGWINESNVDAATRAMAAATIDEMSEVTTTTTTVACATSDFAMQNVLMQMHIAVVAPTGRLIKRLRHYVFKCRACFTVTRDMTKQFCPKCGYASLDRIVALIEPSTGEVQLCLNKHKLRRPPTQYITATLPPSGGKHGRMQRTSEDARLPQQRETRKMRARIDPMADEYAAMRGQAPFAMRDVNSRAAVLGVGRHGSHGSHKTKRGGKKH